MYIDLQGMKQCTELYMLGIKSICCHVNLCVLAQFSRPDLVAILCGFLRLVEENSTHRSMCHAPVCQPDLPAFRFIPRLLPCRHRSFVPPGFRAIGSSGAQHVHEPNAPRRLVRADSTPVSGALRCERAVRVTVCSQLHRSHLSPSRGQCIRRRNSSAGAVNSVCYPPPIFRLASENPERPGYISRT
jgi:hypothetical protein